MKITNFEELFEAFKLIHDIGIQEEDKLEMFSDISFCFYDGEGFEYAVLIHKANEVDSCTKYILRIGEKNIESKDPKRIYDLVKAIIKCED